MIPAYWSSFGRHYASSTYSHNLTFILAVVLDGDAWRDFSGIRVVIVYRESDWLKDIIGVTDYCGLPKPNGDTQELQLLLPRSQLWSKRRMIEASERLLKADVERSTWTSTSRDQLPLCTLTFELVCSPPEHDFQPDIKARLVPACLEADSTRLRIAYDRAYPCTQHSHSVYAFLQSNAFISATGASLPRRARRRPPISSVLVHGLRVLSTSDNRSPFTHPSPEILLQITRFAIRSGDLGWRRELLMIGSVCKSWSHVLSLFFELHTSVYSATDSASAICVARSLEFRPERGQCMRAFSPRNYPEFEIDDPEYQQLSQALLTILRLATAVTRVDVTSVLTELYPNYLRSLSHLRNVVHCMISSINNPDRLPENLRSMDIRDIQVFITNWPHLETLKIYNWAEDNETLYPDTLPPLTCNIIDLNLSRGWLHGPQLLRFVQSPQPRLQYLYLSQIYGLVNRDLLSFLSAVVSTLEAISIAACEISRDDTEEEYALDVMLPRLTSLQTASIAGDHLTSLAIARRTAGAAAYICLQQVPGVTPVDLANALETGCWEEIYIMPCSRSLNFQCAKEVAKTKGIQLHLETKG